MPVADVADLSCRAGVYSAVLAALESEVNRLAGLRFPVAKRLVANIDAMCAGQPVDVSAGYVAASARPQLEPGHPMMQATIRPDGTVTFSQQTAADWLAEAGPDASIVAVAVVAAGVAGRQAAAARSGVGIAESADRRGTRGALMVRRPTGWGRSRGRLAVPNDA